MSYKKDTIIIILIITFLLVVSACESEVEINVIYDAEKGEVEGMGEYKKGETVTLEAIPKDEYEFAYWIDEDEVVSSSDQYSIQAKNNKELKAEFNKKEDIVEIKTTASEGGQVKSSKKYSKKGEEVTIKAMPKSGYFFGAWTREDTEFRFNDLFEPSKELTIKAKENMHIKANFREFDNLSRKTSRVIVNESKISSDDDYFAYLKDNKIKIFNTKTKEEVLSHELKENLTPYFLIWGNNDELFYFLQNKIYKLNLDGEIELIKDATDIYQGVYEGSVQFENIDNNDLFVYYNIKNVVMNEELFRGDLFIEGYISKNKVISIKEDFQIEGGFSNFVFSPGFNKAAISINGTTRIYDLMNNENDAKKTIPDELLHSTEPFIWLDSDNLLLVEGDLYSGGNVPWGNLIRYNIESDKYTYIYKTTDTPLEVSENSLSPKGNKLIVSLNGQITLLEVDYQSYIEKNSEIPLHEIKMTSLGLDIWPLINIFWYDNNTSFIEGSENNKVYLLKNNKLEIFLEDVEEILGIANEELIYIDAKGSVEIVEIG